MDESTDLSTVKQLGIIVQYSSMETATLQCRFLKLHDMSQNVHATTKNIVDCLTKYLDTASLQYHLPHKDSVFLNHERTYFVMYCFLVTDSVCQGFEQKPQVLCLLSTLQLVVNPYSQLVVLRVCRLKYQY